MTKKEIQASRLHRFLRKHKVVRKFKANHAEYAARRKYAVTLEELYNDGETQDNIIMASFIWMGSPEGVSFWSGLNKKYIKSFSV